MVSFIVYLRFFLKTASVGDVGLNSDDGIYIVFLAGHIEFYGSVHCAMVSQGKGSHAFFLCEFDHVFDLGEAVKERVMTMCVQVYEFHKKVPSYFIIRRFCKTDLMTLF